MQQSIDLNRVARFVEIVQAGNISKAARNANVQKSKLSRDLAQLESDLGVQLVYRTTRQFRLTDAGRKLFLQAEEFLSRMQSSLEETSQSGTDIEGLIRLTTPQDIGQVTLLPLIEKFQQDHPKVEFDLILTTEVMDLVANQVDLAVRVGPLRDSTLKRKKVGSVRIRLYCSPKYAERLRPDEDVTCLKDHRYVGFTLIQPTNTLKLTSGKKTIKVKTKPHLVTNNFPTIKDLLKNHQGIGLLPEFLAQEAVQSGALTAIFKEWSLPSQDIQIVTPHQAETPKRIQVFRDFLAQHLR